MLKSKVKLSNYVQKSDALPILTLLGFIIGIFTGLLLLLFKGFIEVPLHYFIDSADHFEQLSPLARFSLVFLGSLFIGVIWHHVNPKYRSVGVSHVLNSLQDKGGRMPAGNIITQFIGGVLALVTGQSAGKEGPAIHLGAGLASIFGQKLDLPNHSIRVLTGCGVAGAIAAFFNTPLAGVIFALEIILIEYSISWAVPIMASAFTASLISQSLWPSDPVFVQSNSLFNSLYEIPFLVGLGFVIGVFAAMFNSLIRLGLRFRHFPVMARFSLAGLFAATIAYWIPQVMGTGYDSIEGVINGEFALNLLLIILVAKILVTASTIGLGMPAGLIGPTLVIGGLVGGGIYLLLQILGATTSDIPIYVLIGTSAMMSAVLQAPITALVTVLEFSSNTAILFPAMIAIIVANLTCRTLFKQPSIFISILQTQGVSQISSPVAKALREMNAINYGVPDFQQINESMTVKEIKAALEESQYLLIHLENRFYTLETAFAKKLIKEEFTTEETSQTLPISTWVDDQNELIWLPNHASMDQVMQSIQGRNIAGIRLSKSEENAPTVILPKKHLLKLITEIGE